MMHSFGDSLGLRCDFVHRPEREDARVVRYHPQSMLNDPTFLGWLTTGAYVATASLCGIAAAAHPRLLDPTDHARRLLRIFWLLLTAALIALAVNKQLDWQTTLTNMLREASQRDGWYGSRRVIQGMLVITAIVITLVIALLAFQWIGSHRRSLRLTLFGMAMLAAFVLLRFADIERAGEMTGLPLEAIGWRSVLEWLALVTIAISAWRIAVRIPDESHHA